MVNPKSTAKIAGHPIHPMLVPFPIAFFTATLASDLAFSQTNNTFWAAASHWLLGAGLVMAALAALMGVIDFLGDRRVRALTDAWLHAAANVTAVLLSLYSFYLRYSDGPLAIVPTGLMLSLAVVVLLLFSGWKGGNLVFHHRVGVSDTTEIPSV